MLEAYFTRETLRTFNILMSDATLLLLLYGVNGFAIVAWRVRNGAVRRRFAEFILSLAFFFDWYSFVDWDRRFDIVPGLDLTLISFEWRWPFRILLVITLFRLGRAVLRASYGLPDAPRH